MKSILFTTLFLLNAININNGQVDISNSDIYFNGLPCWVLGTGDKIDLSYSGDGNSCYSNLYNTEYTYFNNTLSVSDFIETMFIGESSFDILSLTQTYKYQSGDNIMTIDNFPGQFKLYAVFDSYIDSAGNYIPLINEDNNYKCIELGTLINNHYIIEDSYIYKWLGTYNTDLFDFQFIDNRTYNKSIDSDFGGSVNYFSNNAKQVSIKGFFVIHDYTTFINLPIKFLNFMTQWLLFKSYRIHITNVENDPDLITWFNDGLARAVNKAHTFQYFLPYYYLGYGAVNQPYVIVDNTEYQTIIPAITNIYNGLFTINNELYDNIFITYDFYKVQEVGIDPSDYIYVNDITYSGGKLLIIFNTLYAYSSLTGGSRVLITNNYTFTNQLSNGISVKCNTNYDIKYLTLNFINYYRYDTQKYEESNLEYTFIPALSTYTMYYVCEGKNAYLINFIDFNILKDSVSNSPISNNYYDNIFNQPEPITPPTPPTPTPPSPNDNILIDVFNLFSLAFGAVGSFLSIQIFPNISLGLLLLTPLVVLLIIVIIKLFKR